MQQVFELVVINLRFIVVFYVNEFLTVNNRGERNSEIESLIRLWHILPKNFESIHFIYCCVSRQNAIMANYILSSIILSKRNVEVLKTELKKYSPCI